MSRALARTNTALWWIACLFVCAFYLVTVPRVWQCEGVDEIEYLGLSHSLARGYGYTLYGEPYGFYPPLFPVVLSTIMRWNVAAWRWMYTANALLGLVGLIVGATWLRRFGRAGVWAGWFSLIAYYAWSFSTRYLLSEPLFFALSVLVVVLVWRVLERNRCSIPEGVLIGAGALLCAMTRFGAAALLGGVFFASLIRWLTSKVRTGLLVGLILLVTGGGFMIAWEVRAQVVNPNAVESYGRWAAKFLGLSGEKAGMIAQSVGEGPTDKTTWSERIVHAGVRYGQFVSSVVRHPANCAPMSLLLWAVFLTGLIAHMRRCIWSPLGWYTIASLVMISLTSWLSSYLRYFYPLTPFLFFFFFEGLCVLRDRPPGAGVRVVWAVLGVWGLVGAVWPFTSVSCANGGLENTYSMVVGHLVRFGFIGLVIAAAATLWRRGLSVPGGLVRALPFVVLMLLAFQSVLIAGARFRLTLANSNLEQKNLLGVVRCAEWLRENSAPQSMCISSLPRMTAFLSDRSSQAPRYNEGGQLANADTDYILLMGELRDMPAFRPAEESMLALIAERLDREKLAVSVFACDDARVYKVGKQYGSRADIGY